MGQCPLYGLPPVQSVVREQQHVEPGCRRMSETSMPLCEHANRARGWGDDLRYQPFLDRLRRRSPKCPKPGVNSPTRFRAPYRSLNPHLDRGCALTFVIHDGVPVSDSVLVGTATKSVRVRPPGFSPVPVRLSKPPSEQSPSGGSTSTEDD